ncbi:MAG TPA: hypothetical protein VES65_08695 [Solirubrobacteraceae bacterium]|nr:hypothetical protein [Solirubrobacteraceae bacterium]
MSDASPHIRHRVQLPDGKHVEIVYRDHRYAPGESGASDPRCAAQPLPATEPAPAAEAALAANPIAGPDPLHVCFNCASELVYPLDWVEEGDRHWRIVLRCPECDAHREGVFEQAMVERLDDELDRATGELLGDLKQITHANMTDEIEFFVRALDADLIVPSDF